jgi:hypothetical protein
MGDDITGTMAAALTGLAHDLTVKLPLILAALRDGIIDIDKARTIAVTYALPARPGWRVQVSSTSRSPTFRHRSS